jgi:hypothetical protein
MSIYTTYHLKCETMTDFDFLFGEILMLECIRSLPILLFLVHIFVFEKPSNLPEVTAVCNYVQ